MFFRAVDVNTRQSSHTLVTKKKLILFAGYLMLAQAVYWRGQTK